MSIINKLFLFKSPFCFAKQSICNIQSCNYSVKTTASASTGTIMSLGKGKKKGLGKMGVVLEKKVLPVEADTHKLVTYLCGSNILNTGGEDVKLKPDSEYPDWLWTIRVGSPPKLSELDPNTKEYWLKVRGMAMKRNNKLRSLRKF